LSSLMLAKPRLLLLPVITISSSYVGSFSVTKGCLLALLGLLRSLRWLIHGLGLENLTIAGVKSEHFSTLKQSLFY
jgi:hypothetical protein